MFVDNVDYIYITMHIYNLIEYSDNYYDTSGSLWQFKKDEINGNANIIIDSSILRSRWNSKRCKNSCFIKIFKQFSEIV